MADNELNAKALKAKLDALTAATEQAKLLKSLQSAATRLRGTLKKGEVTKKKKNGSTTTRALTNQNKEDKQKNLNLLEKKIKELQALKPSKFTYSENLEKEGTMICFGAKPEERTDEKTGKTVKKRVFKGAIIDAEFVPKVNLIPRWGKSRVPQSRAASVAPSRRGEKAEPGGGAGGNMGGGRRRSRTARRKARKASRKSTRRNRKTQRRNRKH